MAALTGHMLVVDDNRMNRLVLGHSLEQEGHSVEFAENGRQALEMMRARLFDLILLDVLMPEMNGYEVLAEVHADPHLKYIPVVMVSSIDELDSVVKCLEMGAEDYLPKPFKPALLRARVNSTLEKKQLRDRQRELFSKFATQEVADQLLETGFALGGKHVTATAMFSDIRSFTTITESQSADDTITLLNTYFRHMFSAVESEGGIISQIIGDGLLSIFGAPMPQADHRERAVVAALKMVDHVDLFNREQKQNKRVQIKIGIGIASGDMVVGIIGTEKRAVYTCLGDTVNQAARLEAHTKVVGEPILIDENTRQGLSSDLRVNDHGEAMLKGKTVPVHVFSVPPLTL
jgi:class 3 adenylate cyclase